MRKIFVAKIIRASAVPAVWVGLLLTSLYFFEEGIFNSAHQLWLSVAFLGLIPMAAYVLAPLLPKFKDKGAEGKRNLAFIFTFFGYTAGILYGIFAEVSEQLMFIFVVYFLSYIMLLISNKIVKFRASGHACGLFGPVILFAYFLGVHFAIPSFILLWLVSWASLFLKRHTPSELIGGGLVAMVSFFGGMWAIAL